MNLGAKPELERSDYWSVPVDWLIGQLGSTGDGLGVDEAARRLAEIGPRRAQAGRGVRRLSLLIAQFRSPIVLILLFAAILSFLLRDAVDASIILAIVLASGLLGFWQEWGAADALEKLLALVRITATVLRDGRPGEAPIEQVVPGDVVVLNAGDVIPGDGRILEAKDLFVSEATLTGETFPVEKAPGSVPEGCPLGRRANCLFLGTNVVSGTARFLVVRTGDRTEFGRISGTLSLRPPETGFELGIRRFGYMLVEVTLLLVLVIFAINVLLQRPALEAFLFSLAIAVGLTPQLLPAIISVNLAHGAKRMAGQRVIVRRLASIENLGGMDVLCSDKTGTLTEGRIRLHSTIDAQGRPSDLVALHAYLNASLQSGYTNPIDAAIVAEARPDAAGYTKLDEVPYDFIRKRLSVLVEGEGRHLLISKGAASSVLAACTSVSDGAGVVASLEDARPGIERLVGDLGDRGLRALGVAIRDLGEETRIGKEHETGMTFLGLIVLDDPLKAGIAATLARLDALGVSTKIITGDGRPVAVHVAREAGISDARVLTGADLGRMSDEALARLAGDVSVFAEVEPNQKARVILALKRAGHVVGYLGDGINDASALHAADVGISVAEAVDVAREAADIVLLDKDLDVLGRGVREGRETFANTMKYVFMATSANFGNMFSMAAASLFLPFLPLLPKQILLMNLLTDLPEMTIASDSVDPEMVDRPRRWDIGFVRRFMVVFGILSSAFDLMTFAVLRGLQATPPQFRTGWFTESIISAAMIVLVIRTRRGIWQSRPSRPLLIATLAVAGATIALPCTTLAPWLGLEPLSPAVLAAIGLIVLSYVVAAEAAKLAFYRHESLRAGARKPRHPRAVRARRGGRGRVARILRRLFNLNPPGIPDRDPFRAKAPIPTRWIQENQ